MKQTRRAAGIACLAVAAAVTDAAPRWPAAGRRPCPSPRPRGPIQRCCPASGAPPRSCSRSGRDWYRRPPSSSPGSSACATPPLQAAAWTGIPASRCSTAAESGSPTVSTQAAIRCSPARYPHLLSVLRDFHVHAERPLGRPDWRLGRGRRIAADTCAGKTSCSLPRSSRRAGTARSPTGVVPGVGDRRDQVRRNRADDGKRCPDRRGRHAR